MLNCLRIVWSKKINKMDRKTILLVEDDPPNMIFLSCIFKDRFNLKQATNGSEALTAAAKPDSGIDIVVSDIELGGMNGIEIMKQVRKYYPDMPYILMSGDMGRYEQEAISAGVSRYFAKPFDHGELTEAVNKLIE